MVTNEAMYREFNEVYLPDLSHFVLPIVHEDELGSECVGSGVSINILGRHFVASARHCLEHNPREFRGHLTHPVSNPEVPDAGIARIIDCLFGTMYSALTGRLVEPGRVLLHRNPHTPRPDQLGTVHF